MGLSVGKSLVDLDSEQLCRRILEDARKRNIKVVVPIDLQVATHSFEGPLSITDARTITQDQMGISIGPKTIALYAKEIAQAQTIFYNGLMGFQDRPETLQGTQAILQAMANSKGYTVIGGGDTVGAAESLGFTESLSFCSTGGGATLTYLSGELLPGIEAISRPGKESIKS